MTVSTNANTSKIAQRRALVIDLPGLFLSITVSTYKRQISAGWPRYDALVHVNVAVRLEAHLVLP